ncbi:MAG: HU family DNA-binding protein [Crocosphaera sp.]|uniref:Histone-like DNA-binding protein n=1 Tax=Crocosphaera watsonii WH 0005 TaxID=423472 RepID=T2ISY9_CROWT|nr:MULTISPECIES: HU family DNA-binding protein [Crocosphaera]MCH2247849.1 HU family DNA-binding protein [Crocosphaera sp.]CCQ56054.1 Histone-like DNA-binding protein [Crocosphaera watsonii WH 0005]
MNKSEFIANLASEVGGTKKDAQNYLDGILELIQGVVAEGKTITFTGFGTFKVSEQAARKGINPQTGEPLDIAAKKLPRFSAGKTFKEAVNGGDFNEKVRRKVAS